MGNAKNINPHTLRRKIKSQQFEEKRLFLIVAEGKTEVNYFGHFKSKNGPNIQVQAIQGSKTEIVEEAINWRSSYDTYGNDDETWVVFDRDVNKSNPKDKESFNNTISKAGITHETGHGAP